MTDIIHVQPLIASSFASFGDVIEVSGNPNKITNDEILGQLIAFETQPGQGVNYHRNVWHWVFTPLYEPRLFAVIDRIGSGVNLEEYWFARDIIIKTLRQRRWRSRRIQLRGRK